MRRIFGRIKFLDSVVPEIWHVPPRRLQAIVAINLSSGVTPPVVVPKYAPKLYLPESFMIKDGFKHVLPYRVVHRTDSPPVEVIPNRNNEARFNGGCNISHRSAHCRQNGCWLTPVAKSYPV
ncbi:hypothetical protein HWI79_1318 [Cryptosporidium felis]|nr:hypothetical protein HWI79_1318 [Cryptosporidium felis]